MLGRIRLVLTIWAKCLELETTKLSAPKWRRILVDRYTRDMQPQWDQQQQQFIQEMAQRGIPEGSEQFNKQMAAFQKQRDQGLMDITSQAIQGLGLKILGCLTRI